MSESSVIMIEKLKLLVILGVLLLQPSVEAGVAEEVPEVIITNPTSGTAFSKGEFVQVSVEYKASSGKCIIQSELLIDDEAKGLLEIIAPPKEKGNVTFRLDTLPLSLGEHTIKVICRETGPNQVEASIRIKIGSISIQVALERLKDNYGKISDMQGSYIDETVVGNQTKSPVHRKVWLKPPDKSKIVLSEVAVITDGAKVTILRQGKEPQEINAKDYSSTTTATQMDFIYHRDEFVEKHTVNILSENNEIIEIEAIPKGEGVLYSKLKIKVDLKAGVEKEIEVYDTRGSLIRKTEVLSYRKVGEVNLPIERRETYYLDEGTVVNMTRLEEVKINTGIGDDEFK